MATVTRFEFVDDIDGKALNNDDIVTVQWSWLGVEYEFDTSTTNFDRIENGRIPVSTLLAKSHRTGGRKRSPKSNPAAPAAASAGSDTKTIRAWAQQNGYAVSNRGRIPTEVIEAFANQ